MTAKEFLQQYYHAHCEYVKYRSIYEKELESIDAIRVPSDIDGMPHGTGVAKPAEEKVIKLADAKQAAAEAEAKADRAYKKVLAVIKLVPDVEGILLTERYLNLRTWDEVGERLHYSWSGTHGVHKRALRAVQEILNKK